MILRNVLISIPIEIISKHLYWSLSREYGLWSYQLPEKAPGNALTDSIEAQFAVDSWVGIQCRYGDKVAVNFRGQKENGANQNDEGTPHWNMDSNARSRGQKKKLRCGKSWASKNARQLEIRAVDHVLWWQNLQCRWLPIPPEPV